MEAMTYFDSLKSQGYDDVTALAHTNKHYPDFRLNAVATDANYDNWFYQNFQRIAAESYPDDEGAIFTIASITNNGEFIEVVANSNPSVGYDPIRYDFSISNGVPSLEHTFTPGPNGTWDPFFSTGNSKPRPASVVFNSTAHSNPPQQTQPQYFQNPQPQQMMGGQQQQQQQQYANQQQPMMQGQPMQAFAQQGMMQQVATGSRTKMVTLLLALFVGPLGVHNFYLGKTGLGVAQLLITVLTLGIGAIITGPWSLIEGILAVSSPSFRDGDGLALSDQF